MVMFKTRSYRVPTFFLILNDNGIPASDRAVSKFKLRARILDQKSYRMLRGLCTYLERKIRVIYPTGCGMGLLYLRKIRHIEIAKFFNRKGCNFLLL